VGEGWRRAAVRWLVWVVDMNFNTGTKAHGRRSSSSIVMIIIVNRLIMQDRNNYGPFNVSPFEPRRPPKTNSAIDYVWSS
jgi:hypothetical protein